MRNFLSFISLLLFAACSENSTFDTIQLTPEPSKVFKQKLVDSLGLVSLSLPARYDTSFSWTNYSDCGKPCNKIEYRIQSKTLKAIKESGFIKLEEPQDLIERFTIVHSGYFPFHDNNDSLLIFNYHGHKKDNVVSDPNTYKIKSDTLEKIGDRYFSIILIDLYDTTKSQFSKKLLAATSIKSNIIEFNFELLTKQNTSLKDNFLNISKYYLRTVQLSNGR